MKGKEVIAEPLQNSEELVWHAHPMKENPAKGVLFWALILFTIWAIYWNLGSLLLTTVAAGMLLGSLTSFYLPTQYRFDSSGAFIHRWFYRRGMSWQRVRSVSVERDGIFLSPYPLRTRLENFRGVYLPYRENKEQLIAYLHKSAPGISGLPPLETSKRTSDSMANTNGETS